MKTISNIKILKNKRVLLRIDLNSDVFNGKVLESERIKQSVKTIKELKKQKAKITIIAHQGRPKKEDFTGLKQHAKFLNKYTKVKFIPDIIGDKAIKEIKNLKQGEAILLENIRYLKEELNPKEKNNRIIRKLVPLFDIYINDAFSVCHRKQTSITEIPKHLPSYAGMLLEKEVKALKKIKMNNLLFILGGAKPKDNLKLVKSLKNKKTKILTCGLFGQLCLIAKGFNFGAQNKYLKDKDFIIPNLKKSIKKFPNLLTPIDFAIKANNKRKELSLSEFPSNYEIYDIGGKTIKNYSEIIKSHKGSIFMKGPAGFCADKKFCKGTKAILKAISKSKSFSVIGGGHLNDAIRHLKTYKKKFDHISLSGGALTQFIAGEKLPGLEALG